MDLSESWVELILEKVGYLLSVHLFVYFIVLNLFWLPTPEDSRPFSIFIKHIMKKWLSLLSLVSYDYPPPKIIWNYYSKFIVSAEFNSAYSYMKKWYYLSYILSLKVYMHTFPHAPVCWTIYFYEQKERKKKSATECGGKKGDRT